MSKETDEQRAKRALGDWLTRPLAAGRSRRWSWVEDEEGNAIVQLYDSSVGCGATEAGGPNVWLAIIAAVEKARKGGQ